jgi:hypothetical protein
MQEELRRQASLEVTKVDLLLARSLQDLASFSTVRALLWEREWDCRNILERAH